MTEIALSATPKGNGYQATVTFPGGDARAPCGFGSITSPARRITGSTKRRTAPKLV